MNGSCLCKMDRWQALYAFWSGFGLPAYEENSVPTGDDRPGYPYITYEASVTPWDGDVLLSASVWTRSTSWLQADTIADQIEATIRDGYVQEYDGGMIYIVPNDPFSKHMGDPDDNMIKRALLGPRYHFH